jgi:hypothetical protein
MTTDSDNDSELLPCTPRYLPRDRWVEAAKKAAEIDPENVPEGTDLDDLEIPEDGRLALNIRK